MPFRIVSIRFDPNAYVSLCRIDFFPAFPMFVMFDVYVLELLVVVSAQNPQGG